MYDFDVDIDIDKLIADNLQRLIDEKGSSGKKLAKMIGTSESRVSGYANASAIVKTKAKTKKRGMGKGFMLRVCNALNVRPYEFYLEPDTPIIRDDTEMKIIKRMRSHPEIKSHLELISRALIMESTIEDTTIQEEEPTARKEA